MIRPKISPWRRPALAQQFETPPPLAILYELYQTLITFLLGTLSLIVQRLGLAR